MRVTNHQNNTSQPQSINSSFGSVFGRWVEIFFSCPHVGKNQGWKKNALEIVKFLGRIFHTLFGIATAGLLFYAEIGAMGFYRTYQMQPKPKQDDRLPNIKVSLQRKQQPAAEQQPTAEQQPVEQSTIDSEEKAMLFPGLLEDEDLSDEGRYAIMGYVLTSRNSLRVKE